MKIAIVGLGGVGATVAGGLRQYEKDLIFVARGKTKEALQKDGLYLESEMMGDGYIRPALVSDDSKEIGVVDVVFLCCKAYGLESCCKAYGDIVGENTLVVPLLNGVVAKRVTEGYLGGRGIVTDSYIYCFSNILSAGRVKNESTFLRIGMGLAEGQKNAVAEKVVAMLSEGGLPSTFGGDVMKELWQKYSVMGGNSCALIYFDSVVGGIQENPERMAFLANIYEDVLRLAKASGVDGLENMPKDNIESFMAMAPGAMSSLYRDLKGKSPNTEFEWIVGSACKMAKELGIEVPYIEMAYGKKEYYLG